MFSSFGCSERAGLIFPHGEPRFLALHWTDFMKLISPCDSVVEAEQETTTKEKGR